MPLKDELIAELKRESVMTRKMLERVPMDKADWKPHERSMSLGKLAVHVADITHWISDIVNIDDYDFLEHRRPVSAVSTEDLLRIAEERNAQALADLEKMTDEGFGNTWVVRQGDKVYFRIPKHAAIRSWGFSHQFHHRGQLSVYLRLLDVPVPGMYGPTADEAFN
jgi:uncharacterized damage-inducible protein DinB